MFVLDKEKNRIVKIKSKNFLLRKNTMFLILIGG